MTPTGLGRFGRLRNHPVLRNIRHCHIRATLGVCDARIDCARVRYRDVVSDTVNREGPFAAARTNSMRCNPDMYLTGPALFVAGLAFFDWAACTLIRQQGRQLRCSTHWRARTRRRPGKRADVNARSYPKSSPYLREYIRSMLISCAHIHGLSATNPIQKRSKSDYSLRFHSKYAILLHSR